jgi:hypothetical protein
MIGRCDSSAWLISRATQADTCAAGVITTRKTAQVSIFSASISDHCSPANKSSSHHTDTPRDRRWATKPRTYTSSAWA